MIYDDQAGGDFGGVFSKHLALQMRKLRTQKAHACERNGLTDFYK